MRYSRVACNSNTAVDCASTFACFEPRLESEVSFSLMRFRRNVDRDQLVHECCYEKKRMAFFAEIN